MRKMNKFGRIGPLIRLFYPSLLFFWQVRIFHPKVFGRGIERRGKRKKTESSISKLCWCQGKLLDFHPMHNLACIKTSKCRVTNWWFPYKSSNEEERKAPSFSFLVLALKFLSSDFLMRDPSSLALIPPQPTQAAFGSSIFKNERDMRKEETLA